MSEHTVYCPLERRLLLTLSMPQAALCEVDGRMAAYGLLVRLAEHLNRAAYPSEDQRRAAALHVLEAFCEVFADALADAHERGRHGEEKILDVFTAIIRRHAEMLDGLARELV